MGLFKRPKDPETPAPPAPTGADETLQLAVETNTNGVRKRKAKGKQALQIPTTGSNVAGTRGNGVNV